MGDLERLKQGFTVLFDTSFGTLWWADNDLWAQEKDFVLKSEQKKGNHPGVSIRQEKQEDPYVIPLLLGTSKEKSTRQAVALSMNTGRSSSYFGALKPVRMSGTAFLEGRIRSNLAKPQLTSSEKMKLNKFIKRRLSWSAK